MLARALPSSSLMTSLPAVASYSNLPPGKSSVCFVVTSFSAAGSPLAVDFAAGLAADRSARSCATAAESPNPLNNTNRTTVQRVNMMRIALGCEGKPYRLHQLLTNPRLFPPPAPGRWPGAGGGNKRGFVSSWCRRYGFPSHPRAILIMFTRCTVVLLVLLSGFGLSAAVAQDRAERSAAKPAAKSTAKGEPAAEKLVTTKHTLDLPGGKLEYEATAGRLVIKDEEGKALANMFFVAYTRTGKV